MTSAFGRQLRAFRERDGHTRRELAEAAGISEGAIRDYELGKRSPSFEAICRLAVALGVTANDFASCIETDGVFRLKRRPVRVSCSILTFGKYRGWRINDIPGDYLEWLLQEKPRLLIPGQLAEIDQVIRVRAMERELEISKLQKVVEERLREPDDERQRSRKRSDPIFDRAQKEKVKRSPPLTPDPDFFGTREELGSSGGTAEGATRQTDGGE